MQWVEAELALTLDIAIFGDFYQVSNGLLVVSGWRLGFRWPLTDRRMSLDRADSADETLP